MKKIDFLICSLIAALSAHGIIALAIIQNDIITFIMFLISSICGVIAGITQQNKSILLVNLGFLSLNCIEILKVL